MSWPEAFVQVARHFLDAMFIIACAWVVRGFFGK